VMAEKLSVNARRAEVVTLPIRSTISLLIFLADREKVMSSMLSL